MIVLDTNVLSELMRRTPSFVVEGWIRRHDLDDLYTTSINEAEILAGISVLPASRRREVLTDAATRLLKDVFGGRILPFDTEAAFHYAEIMALPASRSRGKPTLDTLIAAMARSQGFSVATRNVSHFTGYGVVVHDPWQDS